MTRPRTVTESEARANARPLTAAILAVAPRGHVRAVPCTVPGCCRHRDPLMLHCDLHRRTIEPRRSAA